MKKSEDITDKVCKVFLKNRYCYHGIIHTIDDKTLTMTDKFNKTLLINRDDISMIEIQNDGEDKR